MKKLTKSLALGMAVTSMLPIASVQAYEVNDVQRKVTVNPYDMAAITGSNRYETAAKLAQGKNKNTVILVNADKSLADGLSASGLAGAVNAPILLVKANKIPAETKAALKGAKNAYIIGGTNAISKSVEKEINSLGIKTERIQGKDRIETSIEVSDKISKITGKDNAVYLVNGFKGEADAMSIAPVAAKNKGKIILTNGKYMPINVSTDIPTYAVGGSSVMSNAIVSDAQATRIGGKDRYETNRKVIEKFFTNEKVYYMAKGNPLVDALTTSAMGKPVALVSERSDKRFIGKADKVISVGGVSNRILTQVRDILEVSHTVGEDGKPVKPEDTQKPGGDTNGPTDVTPEKPVEPKPEPEKPITPEHKHNWVHHDAIIEKELLHMAWDEEVMSKEYHLICKGCRKDFGIYDYDENGPNTTRWENHMLNDECPRIYPASGCEMDKIVEKIIHHPAVYKDKIIKPAYDKCSGCGQIRK